MIFFDGQNQVIDDKEMFWLSFQVKTTWEKKVEPEWVANKTKNKIIWKI